MKIKAGNRRKLHDEDVTFPATLLRVGIVASEIVRAAV
jgi:hypothetical protein